MKKKGEDLLPIWGRRTSYIKTPTKPSSNMRKKYQKIISKSENS